MKNHYYVRWSWAHLEPLVHIGPNSPMSGMTFCGLQTLWCRRVTDQRVPTCFRCLGHPNAKNYDME
jgi:hypothetical protein